MTSIEATVRADSLAHALVDCLRGHTNVAKFLTMLRELRRRHRPFLHEVTRELAGSAINRAADVGGAHYYEAKIHQARKSKFTPSHIRIAGDWAMQYLRAHQAGNVATLVVLEEQLSNLDEARQSHRILALASCVSEAPPRYQSPDAQGSA